MRFFPMVSGMTLKKVLTWKVGNDGRILCGECAPRKDDDRDTLKSCAGYCLDNERERDLLLNAILESLGKPIMRLDSSQRTCWSPGPTLGVRSITVGLTKTAVTRTA